MILGRGFTLASVRALCAQLLSNFLFSIVPLSCIACSCTLNKGAQLCDNCLRGLQPVVPLQVEHYGYRLQVYALARFDGPVVNLVRAKYTSRWVATAALSQVMGERLVVDWTQYDCLVPVPMFWLKKMKRGYNQAEEMAKAIASHKNVMYLSCLQKQHATLAQAGLDQQDRATNTRNSFVLMKRHEGRLEGKRILLVDDLYTSGATVKEAVRVLSRAKPAQIDVIVAARVV